MLFVQISGGIQLGKNACGLLKKQIENFLATTPCWPPKYQLKIGWAHYDYPIAVGMVVQC